MKRLVGYKVRSSHLVRGCHPETCCCPSEYVVEAVYMNGFDASTETSKVVFTGDSEDECNYFIKRVTR